MRRRGFSLTGRHRLHAQRFLVAALDKPEERRIVRHMNPTVESASLPSTTSLTKAEPAAKLAKRAIPPKPTPHRRTKVPAAKTASKPKPATKRAPAKKAPAKAAAKPAARKAATAAKASTNGHAAFTPINVPAIVKRLRAGETMTVIRSEYGAGPKIRKALTEAGYNTKGEKIEQETISTAGGAKATAKRIAGARADGWPWYRIELATGMSERELRELLEQNGYASLVGGRVVVERDEPAPRKAPAKKPAAAKAKAAPARKTAPKPTAKAPVTKTKPKPRRVRPRPGA